MGNERLAFPRSVNNLERTLGSCSVLTEMDSNDTTPLIAKKTATPLPRFQLFILLWVQLAEPMTSQVIYPFINKVCLRILCVTQQQTDRSCHKLVGELPITGGDEEKIGYYAGLIVRPRPTLSVITNFSCPRSSLAIRNLYFSSPKHSPSFSGVVGRIMSVGGRFS